MPNQLFRSLLLAVCVSMPLAAQTTGAGTITGTIIDPSGGVIPAATVSVRNTDTQVDRPLATNEAGIFVAQFLQPGPYEITVTKQGFAKTVRTGLTLQVGQSLTVNLSLAVQATNEAVTVTGESAIVDTEKTEMSQVVSQSQKDNLPIAGRRWEGFALLTPNVTTDGGTGLVAYRGISGLYNQSSVDGTNNSQAFFSETKGRTTLAYVYSMDSIQEFQVASSNYSAELGHQYAARRPFLLPALPDAECARPAAEVARDLHSADSPATAVRWQRRRTSCEGQAFLFLHL
jgi:Carboxypeptidase regulatory-like domain